MNRTQIEVVLLADFGELGVQVDLVPLDEALQSFQVVVDDAVVEVETPAAAAAADASTAAGHARRHPDRRRDTYTRSLECDFIFRAKPSIIPIVFD